MELWPSLTFIWGKSVQGARNKLQRRPEAILPHHPPKEAVLWAAMKNKRMKMIGVAFQNWDLYCLANLKLKCYAYVKNQMKQKYIK